MKYSKISFCLITILCIFSVPIMSNAQNDLRKELDNVYKIFLEAASSGNLKTVKENMSSHSYISTQNETVSAKRNFNGDTFKKVSELHI